MPEKQVYQLEYLIKSSPKILFNRLSTPSGLSEWFADDVMVADDIFTFHWDDSQEKAKLLKKKPGELIRLQWLEDEEEDSYFEFQIKTDSMIREVALIITDFAEDDEIEEAKLLWDSQVNTLMHILGS